VVTAWNEYYNTHVVPFITAAKKHPELQRIVALTETMYGKTASVIRTTVACKKPSPQDFAKLIQPISQSLEDAMKMCPVDKKNPQYNFFKAFQEGMQSLNWLVTTTTVPVVQGAMESADYYVNQILTNAKSLSGDAQAHSREYANKFKDMLKAHVVFVTSNFKAGLEWNMRGKDLANFDDSSSCADAPDAPSAPAAPDAPAGGGGGGGGGGAVGGFAAVFQSINAVGSAGETATTGFQLKKVTSDQKTKNMKDRAVLQPKTKEEKQEPVAATKTEKKGTPRLELSKGTWFCENYEGTPAAPVVLTIENVQMKQNVYIMKCHHAIIKIPDKCKSIQMDSCKKTVLQFHSVVSVFEVVNSQGCKAEILESSPSVSIDKSHGFSLILTKAAFASPPNLFTSNISEINVVIPGKTDSDDPIEIPVPEQFLTTIDKETKKLTTAAVTHGS